MGIGDAAQPAPNAVQDFAYQALESLSFDQLSGDVNSLPMGRLGLLLHIKGRHDPTQAMETRKLRVGQPITPEQFEELSDEQLLRLLPRAYRDFFPGKDICTDGHFYLHDGTAWSFFKAGFLDE